ncbi:outer membrane protein assembly factor BamD [Brevundimonas aveniformis]|uniref:outer membrane protein assembly factor BamD n=1 Tax=Brevundimonas aveniformis TaxID=370977 RepID=UPI0003FD7F62|nr:outer membrane protein assembly factor BamD [Brevundimonas aveniformis]
MQSASIRRQVAAVVAVCVASIVLSGCVGARGRQPRLQYEERPVEVLYSVGLQRLDQRRFQEAVQFFQEVERQHPYSPWSRRAILMQVYAQYQRQNYEDAIAAADRYIQLYPGSPQVSYAYYMKGICYFEQIVDVGRDQAAAGQALNALTDVMRRFPGTQYATDARVKIDMVNDQLAGKEMEIGRWYLRRDQPLAAVGRFRRVVEMYQTTSHTPEALYRLVEAYVTLGLTEEAERNAAVLGHNFPGSRWYSEAYVLVRNQGGQLDQEPQEEGWLQRLIPG